MPIDASLYGQFAPKVRSVDEIQSGMLQNQLAQSQVQQNQLASLQAQNVARQRNALTQAVQSGQIDLSDPTHASRALTLAPDVAPGLLKTIQDGQQAAAKAGLDRSQAAKADTETQASKLEMASRDWAQLDPQDNHAFATVLAKQVKNGLMTSDQATAEADKIEQMAPNDRQAYYYQQGLRGLTVQQRVDAQQKAEDEQGRNTRSTAEIAGRKETTQMTNNTSLATTKMNNDTSRANTATTQAGENARQGATIANTRVLAGLNPDGSPKSVATGTDGQIDLKQVAPEDLAAAYRYKTDGTLPSNMGRGTQGAVESRKIRAIATAIDAQAGDSPEDARYRQLAAKGDVGAIAQMQKRAVAVGANVKNFDFNADQVVQLSGKVDRTGVPIANAWLNAGRRAVTGNPELSAFDTAIKTTVNEFAQIVSGTTAGATTEGEKKKAENLLNAQQTPEQLISTINQMRVESQNRLKSFALQRSESMPTNAARAPAPAGKVVHFGDLK